jgi:hypothetical protein
VSNWLTFFVTTQLSRQSFTVSPSVSFASSRNTSASVFPAISGVSFVRSTIDAAEAFATTCTSAIPSTRTGALSARTLTRYTSPAATVLPAAQFAP